MVCVHGVEMERTVNLKADRPSRLTILTPLEASTVLYCRGEEGHMPTCNTEGLLLTHTSDPMSRIEG